ncbi:putative nuclease HARBI1 [Triplophysa dalaica]|uniref:putative nuclease HARBI1 n=1 Tax=Triplophysa dalaica TaxID=1582913 RepID=UPI0024E00E40|nr:putative nuclease HARBI1 [Triplophysa dalaica]
MALASLSSEELLSKLTEAVLELSEEEKREFKASSPPPTGLRGKRGRRTSSGSSSEASNPDPAESFTSFLQLTTRRVARLKKKRQRRAAGNQFPGHKPVRAIKEEFHMIAESPLGFPNVIGCLDGTHIPIIAPSQNEADYVNRKSIHSINVQIICDAAHIITNVEAKWPGSVHDSRIYRESSLSNRMGQGEMDGLLLGDRGYPCQPTLMTPYPEPEPGPQQHFNMAHNRTRARVEMTIGLLKSRFQCLRHLRVTPERACDIIVACVVLHNIAIIRGEQHPALQTQDPEADLIHTGDFQDGRVVRDLICRNVFAN